MIDRLLDRRGYIDAIDHLPLPFHPGLELPFGLVDRPDLADRIVSRLGAPERGDPQHGPAWIGKPHLLSIPAAAGSFALAKLQPLLDDLLLLGSQFAPEGLRVEFQSAPERIAGI